ncbi:MAG: adenylyl-sulfate kinase [Bacteroidales bacterium]|nr:MAG: adenylyl-sulfate kinase [Bacteroidales bacterium]
MLLIQFTGLSGSGKTTIATLVKEKLAANNVNIEVIDGDEYRKSLCKDLGFSYEDRVENLHRLGTVAKLLLKHNVISIISAINPFESIRKELSDSSKFVKTVWIDCAIETLIRRDPKGLYKRALLPDDHSDKLFHFTGINDLYENPINPDLVLYTDRETPEESAGRLVEFILDSIKK